MNLSKDQRTENYLLWLADRGITSPKTVNPVEMPVELNTKTSIYMFVVAKSEQLKNQQTRDLLKKILQATLINTSQVQIIEEQNLSNKLSLFTPCCTLNFGVELEESLKSQLGDLLSFPSLVDVAHTPTLKRQIWKRLQQLMSQPDFPKNN